MTKETGVAVTGNLYGTCLCGDVSYQSSQQHSEMWNCHCRSCRKANSVGYACWIKTRPASFSWLNSDGPVSLYQSSANMLRSFCSRCGSVLPAYNERDNCVQLPASGITTEHKLAPVTDRFSEDMPLWYDMNHYLPARSVADRREQIAKHFADQRTARLHSENAGSCLCGSVRYRIRGEADAIRGCHCSRCRRKSGAAYFSGMPVQCSVYQLDAEKDDITSFFLPDSKYYSYNFCRHCGSLVPVLFPGGNRAVIAAGTLDTVPPVRLMFHIYYADRAGWFNLDDSARCFQQQPPADYDWTNDTQLHQESQ